MKILAGVLACLFTIILVSSDIDSSQTIFYILNVLLILLVAYVIFGKN